MSIQKQLTKFAQNPDDKFQGGKFPTQSQGMGDMEAMMQATPIPGQSLTQDPASKLPYETPPKYTDLQEFVDESFLIISDPERLPTLFKAMRKGVPVEYIAQKFLERQIQEGNINTDMMLQAIEPTIYILIHMATYGGVEAVLYPEDDMLDPADSGQAMSKFKKATQGMRKQEVTEVPSESPVGRNTVTANDLVAPAVQPRSLLARTKAAVERSKK